MAKIVFTESYFSSIAQITSRRLQDRLLKLISLIEVVPTFGSRKVRNSLKDQYGDSCMVADLSPFLLVFEYDETADVVYLYGVVHQRSIE